MAISKPERAPELTTERRKAELKKGHSNIRDGERRVTRSELA